MDKNHPLSQCKIKPFLWHPLENIEADTACPVHIYGLAKSQTNRSVLVNNVCHQQFKQIMHVCNYSVDGFWTNIPFLGQKVSNVHYLRQGYQCNAT